MQHGSVNDPASHKSGSWAIPSLCRATLSATSEHSMGLLGSSPIPRSLVASCVSFQLRPLPSPGITRLPRYCGPLRHPRRPGLALASCRLIRLRSPLGFPVLRLVPFVRMPSPIPRQDRWELFAHLPSTSAFPRFAAGRLLHHPFRGLHSVHDCYGLPTCQVAYATLYTRGFSSFVASTTAPMATGWSEPVPGRDCPRCGPAPFHGARENPG
jgi:hypothetical protein